LNVEFACFNEGFVLVGEVVAEVKEVLVLRPRMSEARWRRVFLRSVFVLLEAFISKFKGRALEAQKYGRVEFPEKLLRILEEGKIVVRDGAVCWEEIRPRTRENLTASVKAYARGLGTETPMGGELALPEEFTVALLARNRVTHPKVPGDLCVTDEEIGACEEIFKWFMASVKWSNTVEKKSHAELNAGLNESADAQMEMLKAIPKKNDGKE